MRWPYPCFKCKHFPCGDLLEPYCLILYEHQDKAFRKVVGKYRLSKAEATALIIIFKGNGVCMNYTPSKEPAVTPTVIKALQELKKWWGEA